MERVAFMVESTGERVPCLLNPNTIVARRWAGVRTAASGRGRLTSTRLTDDPLIVSGGGRTEYELDLLFDTSLVAAPLSTPAALDVRAMTAPLWRLTESAASSGTSDSAPLARLVWGKSWNVLGVIVAVSERLEQFGADGIPARSWLRLRMIRVGETAGATDRVYPAPPPAALLAAATTPSPPATGQPTDEPRDADFVHQVTGDGRDPPRGERIEEIAARYYPGRPWLWRYLAAVNDLAEVPWCPPGTVLRIPPLSTVTAAIGAATPSAE